MRNRRPDLSASSSDTPMAGAKNEARRHGTTVVKVPQGATSDGLVDPFEMMVGVVLWLTRKWPAVYDLLILKTQNVKDQCRCHVAVASCMESGPSSLPSARKIVSNSSITRRIARRPLVHFYDQVTDQ
ncbi:hypothetical protein E4U26_008068 [Claviceps purpurea]|nr:hypothetical protein E4U26_008068 [Claviceps purpurea]